MCLPGAGMYFSFGSRRSFLCFPHPLHRCYRLLGSSVTVSIRCIQAISSYSITLDAFEKLRKIVETLLSYYMLLATACIQICCDPFVVAAHSWTGSTINRQGGSMSFIALHVEKNWPEASGLRLSHISWYLARFLVIPCN
jgi:hypothetical protein